jgi:hypothetical protein
MALFERGSPGYEGSRCRRYYILVPGTLREETSHQHQPEREQRQVYGKEPNQVCRIEGRSERVTAEVER